MTAKWQADFESSLGLSALTVVLFEIRSPKFQTKL